MLDRFLRDTDELHTAHNGIASGDAGVIDASAPPRVDAETARAIILAFLAEQRGTVASALLPMYPQGTDGYARTVLAALCAAAKAWEVRG